jgi:hypothetical protein
MITKRELISQAYGEIGYSSYTFDLLPEQIQAALKKLQQMAAEWDGVGIRIGYDFDAGLNDDSGLPDHSHYAYAANLSLRIAPSVGKRAPPELMSMSNKAYLALLTTVQDIPLYQLPNTMPLGRGNRSSTRSIQYFVPDEYIATGVDGALDV